MTAPPPGEWMQIAVADEGSDALVGDAAVHRLAAQPDTYEVGTTFAPAHQGKGYATEAIAALVDRLFDSHRAHRVFAQTDGRNRGAQRVLKRLGFRHEGTAKEADWFKGEWTDLMTFAVLAHEWRSRPDRS
jgi:RimJ/RimL family protein N-acetyltransferase